MKAKLFEKEGTVSDQELRIQDELVPDKIMTHTQLHHPCTLSVASHLLLPIILLISTFLRTRSHFCCTLRPAYQMVMPSSHVHHLGRYLRIETEQEEVTPAATATHTSNEVNFDTNMVIILAALLFALICALGINSILRCALRCRLRRHHMENGTSSSAYNTGLKRHVLQSIPVVRHGAGVGHLRGSDCPICLGEFIDGEKVRVLPKCNHGFHVSCIDTWLVSHPSCPICRHSLLEQEQQQPLEPSDADGSGTEPQGNGRQDYLT